MKKITSRQNAFVKYIYNLIQKSSLRKKDKKFVIEGRREIKMAIKSNYKIDTIIFNPNLISFEQVTQLLPSDYQGEIIEVTPEIYLKLAYRESTEGIMALANWKKHSLDQLELSDNPIVLIAENIEKPGNIGAMLRTADAAGIDAFIIANPITDLYNPNIIRSSLGGVFTVQIGIDNTPEVIKWLKEKEITLYSATLQNSIPYYQVDMKKPCAIAVGSEAKGLTEPFRINAKNNILIPMKGQLDSLNVSVSAAILTFEAVRQRSI